jgi:hypothetical protein
MGEDDRKTVGAASGIGTTHIPNDTAGSFAHHWDSNPDVPDEVSLRLDGRHEE